MKKGTAIIAALAAALFTARADADTPSFVRGFVMEAGEGDRERNVSLSLEGQPLWRRRAGRRMELVPEASFGFVDQERGGIQIDRGVWHAGLTPFLHCYTGERSFIELGAGPNYFSGTRVGGQNISTRLQFGDSIGYELGFPRVPWTIGLRFTHFSNAGIERPNWGMNFLQFETRYAF